MAVLLLLLPLMIPITHALNLDKQNPQILSGPHGSYFGFSFDFYQAADKRMHIVVGAPRLNTSLPNVQYGGGVYLCPWGINGSGCSVLPFDQSGDRTEFGQGKMTVFKSNQWLGATVRTWKTSIVACAPLQEYNFIDLTDRTGDSGKTPTGACYITEDLKTFNEFAPCRQTKTERVHFWTSYVQDNRYCETGFSAEISKEGVLLTGAPGGYYFEGRDVRIRKNALAEKEEACFAVAYGEFTQDTSPGKILTHKLFLAAHGSQMQERFRSIIYSYITVSCLQQVEIFSQMVRIISLRGEQTASYFGHSVAVTDVNGDGLEDLLVGAPLFMERQTGGKLLEVGQVYVYKQRRPRFLDRDRQVLTGTYAYGQFGASIAPLGDLDQDGYNDVAVGSPFGGQFGSGCVHIYRGGRSGLSTHSSQILESPLDSPARFGFSLRGGEDIDQNGYPDLIVGAFGADSVYVYRAQPVVILHTSLNFKPDSLNPEEKLCRIGTGDVSCFNVTVCVQTSGKSLTETLSLSANIQLDSQKSRFLRRTLFLDSFQPSKELVINVKSNSQRTCANATAYLRGENEFKDKLSPIVVSVNFSLNAEQYSSVLPPIIQGNTFLQEQIHMLLDCGEDKVCIPNLHLEANWGQEPLVIGEDNLVQIYFTAMNFGEGAYEAELHVNLPPGAHYMKILGEAKEKILCTPRKANGTEIVVCELGNPMKKEQILAGLQLSVSNLEDSEGNISFPMQIKSRNSDNSSTLWVHLNVTVKVSLALLGNTHPAEVVLPLPNWKPKEDSKKPKDKGELVSHIYELHNSGPGTVNVKLVVQSPENHEDDIFLYPLQLEKDKNINCTDNPDLNYLQLEDAEPTTGPTNVRKGDNHRLRKRETLSDNQDDGDTGSDSNSTSTADGPQLKHPIILSCDKSPCWEIECFIENLEKGERVTLKLDSILWISSFMKRPLQPFTLRSRAYFQLKSVPYKIQPPALLSTETHADTVVEWVTPDGQKEIPVWWIILGVLGGFLILSLFIFVMWKCGFFRRMRPPTDDQEELTEDK
ncbi:integrin alpha-IIb-like [Gastrophryne carolinensis]